MGSVPTVAKKKERKEEGGRKEGKEGGREGGREEGRKEEFSLGKQSGCRTQEPLSWPPWRNAVFKRPSKHSLTPLLQHSRVPTACKAQRL
jgi:hypothetical protein